MPVQSNHHQDLPTVSVILPVHNGEKYLAEAVESLLFQTFTNFELIALDDGSTDHTLKILREFEVRDSRVKVIARENRGMVASLNEMIAIARGRYIARMDADDISFPYRLERQVLFLETRQGYVAVGGLPCHINEYSQVIGPLKLSITHEDIDREHLDGFCSIVHPTAMIKKDALEKIGGYREEFPQAQDLDLWLRIAEVGKIGNIDAVLLYFRLHPDSVSESSVERQTAAAKRACEQAWERRGIQGTFKAVEYWRPGKDRKSRHKFALQYGWVAWTNDNRDTWWTYAIRAVRIAPFSMASWRLLLFGLVRRNRQGRTPYSSSWLS